LGCDWFSLQIDGPDSMSRIKKSVDLGNDYYVKEPKTDVNLFKKNYSSTPKSSIEKSSPEHHGAGHKRGSSNLPKFGTGEQSTEENKDPDDEFKLLIDSIHVNEKSIILLNYLLIILSLMYLLFELSC
jgi:hypothetical protein